MSNPLQLCQYCYRSMKYVSAQGYAENPFCRDCLHDRLNRAGYRAGYAQAMRDLDEWEAVEASRWHGCSPPALAIMALAAFLRPGGHG
jgi:hypothetical protein